MINQLSFVSLDENRVPPRNFWDVTSSGNLFEDECYGAFYADQFIAAVAATKDPTLLTAVVKDMTKSPLDFMQIAFFERLCRALW